VLKFLIILFINSFSPAIVIYNYYSVGDIIIILKKLTKRKLLSLIKEKIIVILQCQTFIIENGVSLDIQH